MTDYDEPELIRSHGVYYIGIRVRFIHVMKRAAAGNTLPCADALCGRYNRHVSPPKGGRVNGCGHA